MEKNINIKITTNANTKDVSLLKSEVKKLGNTFNNTDNFANTFLKRLNTFSHIVGTFAGLNLTIGQAVKTGINYNRTLETLTNGLTTLNAMTSSNITSTGRHITLQEKYAMATNEARVQVEKLSKLNKETPHSLSQTVEIYKAMYVSMRKIGASTDDMMNITKQLSIAAGSSGIQFQQLLAGVDGLASGTVLANSELGRFLGGIGLTNEELKKSNDVVGLIQERLKDVKPIMDFDTAVSNLGNSFDVLAGDLTKPLFDELKSNILDLTKYIGDIDTNNLRQTTTSIIHLGGSIATTTLFFKGFNKVSTIYKALTIANTTVTRNFAGQMVTTTSKISLAKIATQGLNKALRLSPFAMVATAVYTLGTALWEGKQRADFMSSSVQELSKSLTLLEVNSKLADVNKQLKEADDRIKSYSQAQKLMYKSGYDALYKERGKLLKVQAQLEAKANPTQAKAKQNQKEILSLQNSILGVQKQIKAIQESSNLSDTQKNVILKANQKNLENYKNKLKELQSVTKNTNNADKLVASVTKNISVGSANAKNINSTIAKLKEFENAYNQSVLSASEYEKLQLQQRYDEYVKAGANKLKIDKWYASELSKLNKSGLEEKKQAQQQFADDYDNTIKSETIREYEQLTLKYNYYKKYVSDKIQLDEWYNKKLKTLNDTQLADFKQKELEKKQQLEPFKTATQTAFTEYSKTAGDAYSQVKQLASSSLTKMEDSIASFVTTGKFSFKDFANSILSDLARIAVKQSVSSLTSNIFGGASSSGASSSIFSLAGTALSSLFNENGGYIPTKKYAHGGLLYGGSGVRDDLYLGSASGSHVFAMGGEYIVNKNAVNSVGVGAMDYINQTGNLPALSVPTAVQNEQKTELIINVENKTGQNIDAKMIKHLTQKDKNKKQEVINIVLEAYHTNSSGLRDTLKGSR